MTFYVIEVCLNHLVTTIKSLSFNISLLAVAFGILFFAQSYLTPLMNQLELFFYVSLGIGFFLSAQFNQSRFSLLLLFLLSLYLSNQFQHPFLVSWQSNEQWQLLTTISFFTYLSWCKDRGLFSIYSLYRIGVALTVIGVSYAYLNSMQKLPTGYPEVTFFDSNFILASFYAPILLGLIVVFVAALMNYSLFSAAIFITAIVTFLLFLGFWPLSWLLTFSLLSVYFVICVITSTYFLAYRDELTGLASRRALYQKSLSLSKKYSVAMMDIDHFKKFNDTYGHDVGDQVLRLVAAQLAKVKSGGKVFRYGGEEFTVIFPRKMAEQIIHELECLRLLVADYPIVLRDENRPKKDNKQSAKQGKASRNKSAAAKDTVSVTISIGVVSAIAGQTFDEVMKAADEKLYEAKGNGRNNVCS